MRLYCVFRIQQIFGKITIFLSKIPNSIKNNSVFLQLNFEK